MIIMKRLGLIIACLGSLAIGHFSDPGHRKQGLI